MSETKSKESAAQPFTPIDQHLFESRSIFVTGVVNADLALNVNRQLLALERASATSPIVLWINSPGGEVYSGFSVYDLIQFIKPRVITVVAGSASSMGSVIALAAEKEDRLALPNAKILIHQPLIGGELSGSASEIEIHAKDLINLKNKMHKLYADRTGQTVEKFKELMDRDRWVDPEEGIKLGLISKIITSRKELDDILKK
jgi:ATP-dependent Clp protease protease subunit